jgi:hypothetical protein
MKNTNKKPPQGAPAEHSRKLTEQELKDLKAEADAFFEYCIKIGKLKRENIV